MATEFKNHSKLISRWLDIYDGPLSAATECIVLGMGSAEPLEALIQKFPGIKISVVDPRINNEFKLSISSFTSIKYITSIEGVKILAKYLEFEKNLIPILNWKPAWYPETIFFKWAQYTLINGKGLEAWNNSESLFILESLFK